MNYVKVDKDYLKGFIFKLDVKVQNPPLYSQTYCDEMNRTDSRVHDDEYWCQWVAPYGFVPEAGCPKHD